jgi:hypothetical protein
VTASDAARHRGASGRGTLLGADLKPPIIFALTDDGCLLPTQSGPPTGRFGEAIMANEIGVIANVVDPART